MPSTHLVIAGFEEDLARLEMDDGRELLILKSWLPPEATEGDHLQLHFFEDSSMRFEVDHEATRLAWLKSKATLEVLNKNDTGGDLKL